MKLIHLSDLHLGKRVNEFSMIEDQKHILSQIIKIADDERPDGVIIAGDVYDKSVPSTEAVEMFDDFLVRLSQRKLQVYIISGNHDSPERLAFGGRLMDMSGIHISPVYKGGVRPVTFDDEFGRVNIYLLPFIRPGNVKETLSEEEREQIKNFSYTDAVGRAIEDMHVNFGERNILAAHQFVTGSERSESEEISVGGLDNVDACVFDSFDYTALGHIHRPQNAGSEKIRYCGSPLKYSFSEAKDKKSVTVATLGKKGDISVRTVPLKPLHDMVEIKGSYDEITLKSFYENTSYREDYIHITLTDEMDIPDAASRLRPIYHNLMKLDYENTRTQNSSEIKVTDNIENKTPLELFSEFYRLQNGADMSEEQTEYIKDIIDRIESERQ